MSSHRVQELLRQWKNDRQKMCQDTESNLEKVKNRKKHTPLWEAHAIEAVAFWRFFYENSEGMTVADRRDFLGQIDSGVNHLLDFVLEIEALPVTVWRKILWRYNIDFKSMESFLRRISVRDTLLIKENYKDLFDRGEVPRVFSRCSDQYNKLRGKLTVENLLTEEEDRERRYSHRSAWAFNMFCNSDLGYPMYQGDVYKYGMVTVFDDTPTVWRDIFDLFRVENTLEGFVYDKEFGRYYNLYKVIWGKKTEPSNRPCVDFWKTLLIAFVLAVISPACFMPILGAAVEGNLFTVGSPFGLSHLGFAVTIGMYILGAVTPIWCSMKVLKIFWLKVAQKPVENLVSWLDSIQVPLPELSQESKQRVKSTVNFVFDDICPSVWKVIKASGWVVGLFCVIVIAVEACDKILFPAFGVEGAISLLAVTVYYVYLRIRYKGNVEWRKNWLNPIITPAWVLFAVFMALGVAMFGPGVVAFINGAILAFWGATLTTKLFITGGAVVYIVVPFAAWMYALEMDENWKVGENDKFFDFIEGFVGSAILATSALWLVAALYYNPAWIAVLVVLVIIAGIFYLSISYGMDPRVKRMNAINKRSVWSDSNFMRALTNRGMLGNKWLQRLGSLELQQTFLDRVYRFTYDMSSCSRFNYWYDHIVKRVNQDSLNVLEDSFEYLSGKSLDFREFFIEAVLKGLSAEEAAKNAERRCEQKEVRKQKCGRVNEALYAIFWDYSLKWIWLTLKLTWGVLVSAVTLVWFRKKLNEICPYAEDSGRINI